MTTQPKQIPPRGSDKFTRHCITVMAASLAGANIETSMRERSNWRAVSVFAWDWANQNYRIAPVRKVKLPDGLAAFAPHVKTEYTNGWNTFRERLIVALKAANIEIEES